MLKSTWSSRLRVLFVVCAIGTLLAMPVAAATASSLDRAMDRDVSPLERVVRFLKKHFVPTPLDDYPGPPKP
jgi:hypothetical protein